ncbi:MAG: AbrB/MazE/SpoVT family DNA-binding domain-containing protein [Candidatus Cloacimonetes bacterium]|nr:AbrB/MazE/SpoVT family DNA-binding domain-containing protein [Candidatus Cloacimonadota bacterium]
MPAVTISAKGQIVIPAPFREELGFLPGKLVQVIKTGVGVLVKPLAKNPIDASFGKFAGIDLYQAIKEGREKDKEFEERLIL